MAVTSAHTTSELGHMYSDGHGFRKDETHAQDLYGSPRGRGRKRRVQLGTRMRQKEFKAKTFKLRPMSMTFKTCADS